MRRGMGTGRRVFREWSIAMPGRGLAKACPKSKTKTGTEAQDAGRENGVTGV